MSKAYTHAAGRPIMAFCSACAAFSGGTLPAALSWIMACAARYCLRFDLHDTLGKSDAAFSLQPKAVDFGRHAFFTSPSPSVRPRPFFLASLKEAQSSIPRAAGRMGRWCLAIFWLWGKDSWVIVFSRVGVGMGGSRWFPEAMASLDAVGD